MYNKRKEAMYAILLTLLAIAVVIITEQFIQPAYATKSIIKILSFMGTIFLYCIMTKQPFSNVVRLHKIKNIKPLLLCMLCFFIGTAVLFMVLRGYMDLQNIKQSLETKENLTKRNCLFVFSYIIVCNSFLEECFFRGFVSDIFQKPWAGRIVSAVLFSLYHIGIFITWFSPFLFALCLVGLTAVGLFLQWLSEKYGSILASYITHACANIAINMIGALLIFGFL